MNPQAELSKVRGFALVVTLSLMILLTVIAVGLLTLSAISLRSTSQADAMATARANARLALMLAIGELQKQAGPDQRITAPAGILDATPATPEVDGVPQQNWLGVWDSWGAWINSNYASPTGGSLKIQDTYVAGRKPMFRGWLVSGEPPTTLDAAKAATPFGGNSVALVKPVNPVGDSREARAGLVLVKANFSNTGGFAWWIGGENQKADLALNAPPASLGVAATETATGNTVSRRLTEMDGMQTLTRDPELVPRLITPQQARLGGADAAKLQAHFHDLTAYSSGLITDVRWGGLRKDMSLLFNASALPSQMGRDQSPRPMSGDLSSYNPKIPGRPFTSFEQMYQFARQYKNTGALTDDLTWSGMSPATQSTNTSESKNPDELEYRRMPILVKSYNIFNLQSELIPGATPSYKYWMTYSPVLQLWNPYNVPLELDSGAITTLTLPYKIFPIQYKKMAGATAQGGWTNMDMYVLSDRQATFQGVGGTGKIRFKSGEFIIFSLKTRYPGSATEDPPLTPGFDPAAVGSVRAEIQFSPAVLPADNPGLALRIHPYISPHGDLVYYYGGNPGAFCQMFWWLTFSGINIDWFGDAAGDFTVFAPDSGPNVARWKFADSEPLPIAVFGITLKSSEKLVYDSTQDDWRSRTWIQSPPAMDAEEMLAVYGNPELLAAQRRNCSLQAHWKTINGVSELSEVIPHINNSGFMGAGSAGSEKIAAAAVLELPSAPVQSMAGFSGLRLQPGWFNYMARNTSPVGYGAASSDANMGWRAKVGAYRSGVPGVGVGNSFACPMIPGEKVYAYHDVSKINLLSHDPPATIPSNKSDSAAFSDFWDHALLVNDGLWDSWFLSSLTDSRRPTDTSSPTLAQLLDQTFTQRLPLPNANFTALDQSNAKSAITDLSKADGYLRAAQYLANRGAFNVNSVSVDAWLALFSSLRDHEFTYRNANGTLTKIAAPTDSAVITRFNTETCGVESPDPRSGVMVDGLPSWSGVRFINDAQLKLLAEKCVEQVKIRGPFLNFSDFINRRLSADALGTRGALQAAIDYDDDSPDSASINYRYKKGGASDMLTLNDTTPAAYPFPAAATGSRFTAAPGYVVQSDFLKPLGNALAVRDDTFRIRAYGQAMDNAGKVTARAWCEATVQRVPEYIDSSNPPSVAAISLDAAGNPTPNAALKALNKQFGRRLQMVSFRWLSPNEL